MPSTIDHERNAQKAAEEHLQRCEDDLAGDGEAWEDTEHYPSAPFCGCITCVVREVLTAAWPHLLELAREEAQASAHLKLVEE